MNLSPKEKQILDAIVSALDGIKQSVRAIRDQRGAQSHTDSPEPIRAVVRLEPEEVRKHDAAQERNTAIQNSIKRATWCAFVAASLYAFIAAWQLHTMRQQLSGTVGAALDVGINAIVSQNGAVEVHLTNIGHVTGTNIRADLLITKWRLPSGGAVGDKIPLKFTFPELVAQQEIGDMIQPHPRTKSTEVKFSESEIGDFKEARMAIRVEGQISYDDGFREKADRVCAVYADTSVTRSPPMPSQTGVSCDQFDDLIGAVLEKRRSESHK